MTAQFVRGQRARVADLRPSSSLSSGLYYRDPQSKRRCHEPGTSSLVITQNFFTNRDFDVHFTGSPEGKQITSPACMSYVAPDSSFTTPALNVISSL